MSISAQQMKTKTDLVIQDKGGMAQMRLNKMKDLISTAASQGDYYVEVDELWGSERGYLREQGFAFTVRTNNMIRISWC